MTDKEMDHRIDENQKRTCRLCNRETFPQVVCACSGRKLFDSSVIIGLLEKKLLSIVDNQELGILSIKCHQPHHISNLQKTELNEFVKAIEVEFNRFLHENNILDNNYKTKIEKDSYGIAFMTVSVPNLKTYNSFIEQLDNKQLLRVREPRE